jgi:hypothetical protein
VSPSSSSSLFPLSFTSYTTVPTTFTAIQPRQAQDGVDRVLLDGGVHGGGGRCRRCNTVLVLFSLDLAGGQKVTNSRRQLAAVGWLVVAAAAEAHHHGRRRQG